jgi:hypothetical protein
MPEPAENTRPMRRPAQGQLAGKERSAQSGPGRCLLLPVVLFLDDGHVQLPFSDIKLPST